MNNTDNITWLIALIASIAMFFFGIPWLIYEWLKYLNWLFN